METFKSYLKRTKDQGDSKLIVQNVVGTADEKCDEGSWKDWWLKWSGQDWPKECSVVNCKESPEHGAHVRFVSGYDDGEYIVPLCAAHNNAANTDAMVLRSGVKMVKI